MLGLSHITRIVKDIERTGVLYNDLFGAQEVYTSGDVQFSLSREKFFLICGIWFCIMEGPPLPIETYNHIAFQIAPGQLDAYREKIQRLGLTIRQDRPRVNGEGNSIYFFDYDNHLFELHTGNLNDRLARYARGKCCSE